MEWVLAANLLLASSEPTTLKVMTFNLRNGSGGSPHSWAERRPLNKALLDKYQPDLIGTQEGFYNQVRDIAADQPGYAWIGTGRDDGGSGGEFMAIYYRAERFEPTAFGHFWLSDTPEVMGSKSWGNNCVRMATWARLRDKRTGREFHLLNTHLDHESQPSRERSAALILERIAKLDPTLPLIITGDFNMAAGHNPVYDQFLAGGLVDTWTTASERGPLLATYHGYREPRAADERIDWILTRGRVEAGRIAILTDRAGTESASDHFPVMVDLRLQA